MEQPWGGGQAHGLFTNTQHKDSVTNLNISLFKGLLNRSIYEIYIVFL